MTAQAYNALDGDSLGADKIIRATTMQSLYDNPTAIAQRGSGAPWNNGIGAMAVLTSGSGNWTVPDGVYRIKVTAVGGGGGGQGLTAGGNGGNTTFGSLTANGGTGGTGGVPGAGGGTSGADVGIPGQDGAVIHGADGGSSHMGAGGWEGNAGTNYGGGGGGSSAGAGGGGGGATGINYVSVTPGASVAYSVGAAGTAGTVGGSAGAAGIIIIEY